jgi:hypothetical protein
MMHRRSHFGPVRRDYAAQQVWPTIVQNDPILHPGLMQRLAAVALHRQAKPHRADLCSFCIEQRNKWTSPAVAETAGAPPAGGGSFLPFDLRPLV